LAFQASRNLRTDGICGPQTWQALFEAAYTLGDRLLYLRRPPFRGDDVADLQRSLSMLGFDPGRIDGIFGDQTGAALEEFQRNVGLPRDGIVGADTVRELRRLRTPGHNPDHTVTALKELERFRVRATEPTATLLVAIASTGARDALADLLSLHLVRHGARPLLLDGPNDSHQAQLANRSGSDLLLALRPEPQVDGARILFYSGYRYESPVGRALAQRLAGLLEKTAKPPSAVETQGLALPLLRETTMPALIVEIGPPPQVAELAALAAPLLATLADNTAMS
jgi:N-acetylmuramoyl-L-alanine amidase